MDQSGVGDALLREKIVASATREEIIIADSSKEVLVPANFLCPVEVIRFAEPVRPDQLRRMLAYMLDENEFLSPYGVAPSLVTTGIIRSSSTWTAKSLGWITSRVNPELICSAATPTGAVQSECRSIFSSCAR